MSQVCLSTCAISIHALRGEGDAYSNAFTDFLRRISIHALRGEGDAYETLNNKVDAYISIHALRGEGDVDEFDKVRKFEIFQSTPSVGRATAKIYKYTILRLYIVYIKLYIFATAVLFT